MSNALARIESTAVIPFDDVARMGQVMAQSKLFGIQNEQQAVALMLLCQSENLHPATAMRDYHLIQGRPALKADAMLARFQAAGGKVKWSCYTDERVEGIFSHPSGDTITIEWTPQRVAKAGIKNDMHGKYPRQMLKARCISEGIRAIYPGVLSGMYAPEEIQDITAPAEAPSPAAALTRTDQAKSKLLADRHRKAVTESIIKSGSMPPLDIDPETGEVLPELSMAERIAAANSLDELEALRADIQAMQNGEKAAAIAAFKARKSTLA